MGFGSIQVGTASTRDPSRPLPRCVHVSRSIRRFHCLIWSFKGLYIYGGWLSFIKAAAVTPIVENMQMTRPQGGAPGCLYTPRRWPDDGFDKSSESPLGRPRWRIRHIVAGVCALLIPSSFPMRSPARGRTQWFNKLSGRSFTFL